MISVKIKGVVPWKCHICNREFDTPGGGVCSRCHRATCRAHLYQVGKQSKLEARWICERCILPDEKSKRKRLALKLSDLVGRFRKQRK